MVGKVLSDALLGRIGETRSEIDLEIDGEGWPVLRFGHSLTPEEAKTLVEEN